MEYKKRLDMWVEDRTQPFLTDDFGGALVICGSGGSPKLSGDTAIDYTKTTKGAPLVVVPAGQNFYSKVNSGIRQLAERQKVLGVYVREYIMFNKCQNMDETMNKDSRCRFWGMFSCVNATVGADKRQDVLNEM